MIANNIRRIRKEKGYSQEYIAAKLGCSQMAVSKYEHGAISLTRNLLERFATALECSLKELKQEESAQQQVQKTP